MYQISRSIYRELADDIIEDRPRGDGPGNHERVLRACEATVTRLATDRHNFARPTRTLFNDIRIYFPIAAQYRVYQVVHRYLRFAQDYLATEPLAVLQLTGRRAECRATTRKGTPCRRTPLPLNGYCPSHQHLVETEDVALAA
jgi:hypothetical protein